jgi:hypothetical protein
MKIAGVALLTCFVAVLGFAPFASATRIDFDNLMKYSFDAGYGQKNRGSIIREFAQNGGWAPSSQSSMNGNTN